MKKLYGSSSAFLKGRLVFSSYDSGCLRSILAKGNGFRTDISKTSQDIGAKNEQRYEQKLEAQGAFFERESPIRYPLDEGNDVWFSGRRDFIVDLGAGGKVVVELKATASKNKYQMLREGRYVTENLAQLVAYMVAEDVDVGHLIYSYYKDPAAAEPHLERDYLVTVSTDGDILVDGRHSGFTVTDLLAHQFAAVDALANGTVYDRPHNWTAKFGSPCGYCPLKSVCDRYDAGEVTDYVSAVHELASPTSIGGAERGPAKK